MTKQGGPKTRTAPEHERAPHLGIDPIVALWAPALAAEIEVPEGVYLTIGSAPERDVVVPHASVSRMHARGERRGDVIAVTDQGSKNGTSYNGRAWDPPIIAIAGGLLKLGEVATVLMTRSMSAARNQLAHWIGFGTTVATDEMLRAFREEPILITGPNPAVRLRVARAMRLASPRRARPLLEVTDPLDEGKIEAAIAGVAGGTVFVDAAAIEAMSARGRRLLFANLADPYLGIRAYWLGNSMSFGINPLTAKATDAPALVSRAQAGELMLLLDGTWRAFEAPVRTSMLTIDERANLAAAPWEGDYEELDECARYLVYRIVHGLSQRRTAVEMGKDRNWAQRSAKRWGVR